MMVADNVGLLDNPEPPEVKENVQCGRCEYFYHYTTQQTLEDDHGIEGWCHHCSHAEGKIDTQYFRTICTEDESQRNQDICFEYERE